MIQALGQVSLPDDEFFTHVAKVESNQLFAPGELSGFVSLQTTLLR